MRKDRRDGRRENMRYEERNDYDDRREYGRRNHGRRVEVDGDLGSIKMKIPSFQGRNDPEAYLE